MNIPLGYEIGTGHAVEIPLRHLAVTGQTQLSGKTSTLEALVSRAGLRAVAFVTKRGESGFQKFQVIPPYFRERTDWQSVEAMLEAAMRERLKFERPWIIRVSKGAASLAQVHENVRRALEKARGLQQSVYELLNAYLEIVLPQIDALPYSPKLELRPGINVMDLRAYTAELQALVIRSVLDWIYEHEEKVVTIVPEAWEFIPQDRGSPVLAAAEMLIRKGGATQNFIWLDSQDLAAVNKKVLKSVGVYILGVQREENEVVRTLKHIGLSPRPEAGEIRGLGLGQFYVCYDREIHKVYVQPTWADALEAKAAALSGGGVIPPPARRRSLAEEDPMWKEKYEAEHAEVQRLTQRLQELESEFKRLKDEEWARLKEAHRVRLPSGEVGDAAKNSEAPAPVQASAPAGAAPPANLREAVDDLWQNFKERALAEEPKILKLLLTQPEIQLQIKPQIIELNGDTLQGRIAKLITENWFEQAHSLKETVAQLQRQGINTAPPNVWQVLQGLARSGFLIFQADKTYVAAPGLKISKERIASE